MAKAVADPAELRRFARDLNRFNGELQGLLSNLHSRLHALEKTWRDQEQKKFSDEFTQTTKVLNRFVDSSNQHSAFLLRKAQQIEAYLNQR